MRVQCLPTTVVIIIFLLLAGISHPKRRMRPTVTAMGVDAVPVMKSKSVLSSDLDNLRRSIAVLRHAVGNSIAGSVLRLPSSQNDSGPNIIDDKMAAVLSCHRSVSYLSIKIYTCRRHYKDIPAKYSTK
ncbi:hypothetical protein WUBG_03757 [Wuchereria bancrofti]|uniref:Uncharacterized protein n=1 Tax=Wuchereria bancrofti TaxID=6293 RepID=J9FD89_WUCBA|nr:hypothetical protein WUBG_03757 [Wuchereria bancrofti]